MRIEKMKIHTRYTRVKRFRRRRGAIVPLFAILLPMLLVFAGFAINLAYMQLITTELKIATDAAAHAGGRAMSVYQTTDAAIAQAELTAQANTVGGRTLAVGSSSSDPVQIVFGRSIRADNGYGMYEFTQVSQANVDNGSERATSLGVIGNVDFPMVFNVMNISSFQPFRRSIATQVDRDIALVLDRSGSMLYFRDEELLEDTLLDLYNDYVTTQEEGYYKYRYWEWSSWHGHWHDKGYRKPEDASSSWYQSTWDYYWVQGSTTTQRRISWSEYSDATEYLYYREFSNNVIFQIEAWFNSSHTLGSTYSSSENSQLTIDMAKYTHDWEYESGAARYSRWWYLDQGVDAFLDVLDQTDQEELVSLITFNNSATFDISLQDTYDSIRDEVATIEPYGGTAVGDGMATGLPPIVDGTLARPFAAKTIVVLTDGISNAGQDPLDAVEDIVDQYAVTIHTVTFSNGADQSAMQAVAEAGFGRHYHADDGDALIQIFEEIANNLPTILTE